MSARALSAVLKRYETEPFAWGSSDCTHFALEAHAAAGRRDLRGVLPPYASQLGAFRALRSSGYLSLIQALNANATPIVSARAMPGDVAYFDQPPIGMLGVVVGADALFLSASGLVKKPVAQCFCWRAV